jgi:hypothetical protein
MAKLSDRRRKRTATRNRHSQISFEPSAFLGPSFKKIV